MEILKKIWNYFFPKTEIKNDCPKVEEYFIPIDEVITTSEPEEKIEIEVPTITQSISDDVVKEEVKEESPIELILDAKKPVDGSVEIIKDIPSTPLEIETVKDIKLKSRKKPIKDAPKKDNNPKKGEKVNPNKSVNQKPKKKQKPKSE